MWRQFIAQIALASGSAFWHLTAQLAHLSQECIDAELLLVNQLIELLQQIFGVTGLDFQRHQAFFYGGFGLHPSIGTEF